MGRPFGTKNIENPEKLFELFESYKEETFKEKITVPQSHVKLGVVYLDYYPPLTEQGFEAWLFDKGVISVIRDYFINKDERYSDYITIVTRIKNEIYSHNFKYAAIGAYKENLIARQLGLADKAENKTEHSGSINANFGNPLQSTSETKDNT